MGMFGQNSNVVLITLDGFRWQELFSGADQKLITNENYVHNPEVLNNQFWKNSYQERRKALLPFIWNTVNEIGQIHGNRSLGNQMDLTNTHLFSYPGYNEILSGFADDKRIFSNDKIPNPNKTVLEKINENQRFKGEVAAFCSWDVFPSIINEKRSGIPVNAGYNLATGNNLNTNEKLLNKIQQETPKPWNSVRYDVFTHNFALEYMKKEHPNLIYISYGETDDFAHDGEYDSYLKSAHRADQFVRELWNFVENDRHYKGNTTFIITTDHGRGTIPLNTWTGHGKDIEGANEVWLIIFGKGIKAKGEVTQKKQLYTNQIATSIAHLLNVKIDEKQMGFILPFLEQ